MPDQHRTGRRPGAGVPRHVQVSKVLSWLLRHGAEREGMAIDTGGWANAADVLANRKISALKVTFPEIQELVANNDKQRFTLMRDPLTSSPVSRRRSPSLPLSPVRTAKSDDPRNWLIRAAQGHSLSGISNEEIHSALSSSMPECPNLVVHGTYPSAWKQIEQSGGLKPMTRKHIHFATGPPKSLPPLNPAYQGQNRVSRSIDENEIVSGMRGDATILIWVDVKGSMRDGVQWWTSDNRVILTEGKSGLLDLKWVAWVERRGTDEILYGDKVRWQHLRNISRRHSDASEQAGGSPEIGNLSISSPDADAEKAQADSSNMTRNGSSTRKAKLEVKDNWDDS